MVTRGRPPVSCKALDEKVQARPTKKGKSTLLKKCTERGDHPVAPCQVSNGHCVSIGSPPKPKEKRPKTGVRGRPVLPCAKIDETVQAKKTPKGKATALKKCTERASHSYAPCKVRDGRCFAATASAPAPAAAASSSKAMKTCGDANLPKSAASSKSELRKMISARCKTIADSTGKPCGMSQKGTCRDMETAAKKKALMLRTGKALA